MWSAMLVRISVDESEVQQTFADTHRRYQCAKPLTG
jgi:hypothetical protein